MTDLDLSKHSLNLSGSKQRYSFPKTKRFVQSNNVLCESLYQLPTTISKRGTSLGYGNKSMGIKNNTIVPGVGSYSFDSSINPEKNMRKSISFGVSREKMEQGGPLGDVKYLQKFPSPDSYREKDVHDRRAPTMRSRHPDHDFERSIKNPGPGTYQHENMGSKSYYLTSLHKNQTNIRISQLPRLESHTTKRTSVGPTDYNPIDSMNARGKYAEARRQSINSCVFSKSQRQGLTEKTQVSFPGPGQYQSFSGFGSN